MSRSGRVMNEAATAAAAFVLVGALCLAALATLPLLVGWRPVTVISGSMAPAVGVGDVVVAQPRVASNLGQGTVVVFDAGKQGVVTHRIVGHNSNGTYITRGDANAWTDSTPLAPEQIRGVGRLLVPLIGRPALWLRNGDVAQLVALAALLGFSALKLRRGPRRTPAAAAVVARTSSDTQVFHPTSVPVGAPTRRPILVRRRLGIALGLVAGTLLPAAVAPPPTHAAFSDRATNTGSVFSSALVKRLYLKTSAAGDVSSSLLLPLSATAPTTAALPNYDLDRDARPGLGIRLTGAPGEGLTETDPDKSQYWSTLVTTPVVFSGELKLSLASAMKNGSTTARGTLAASVLDCVLPSGNCTTVATTVADAQPWSPSGGFVARTLTFGSVSYTIATGHHLALKVVVPNSSAGHMDIAYDTVAFPGNLQWS